MPTGDKGTRPDAPPASPGPRPRPPLEPALSPAGCWVTYAPCGCRAHADYMPGILGLMERHPRGAWITHWGPGNVTADGTPAPHKCQTSGRVTGVEPCTDPACPYCSADRVAWARREHAYPRAEPNPDRPVWTVAPAGTS